MGTMYSERGGLRWGSRYMGQASASWPFARLTATSEGLEVRLSVFGVFEREYSFSSSQIIRLRAERGMMNTGLVVEHEVAEYPDVIKFWSFNFLGLKRSLETLGYEVGE